MELELSSYLLPPYFPLSSLVHIIFTIIIIMQWSGATNKLLIKGVVTWNLGGFLEIRV